MHFAIEMLGTAVLCIPLLLIRPRWWPVIPLLQGFGGVFAMVPDLALAYSYYPSLPMSDTVDRHAIKQFFHQNFGNVFFFHSAIDNSGEGNFLRGFLFVAIQYNAWICVFCLPHFLHRRGLRKR